MRRAEAILAANVAEMEICKHAERWRQMQGVGEGQIVEVEDRPRWMELFDRLRDDNGNDQAAVLMDFMLMEIQDGGMEV